MPSEDVRENGAALVARALAALAPRLGAFHGAVAAAADQVRRHLAERVGDVERAGRARAELGPFAEGRIDPERFAQLLGAPEELDADANAVLAGAEMVLEAFVHDDQAHVVHVPPGGDLRDLVKNALASAGRVFGAARVVDLVRSGRYDAERHVGLLEAFPFRQWNRAERQLAPPLVVDVAGEDCLPAGLGEFLDGGVCIALVAKGPTAPAPLARLITPGTFVVQTTQPEELAGLATSAHAGVGVVFDQERPEQVRFVHDPEAGDTPWSRLVVTHMPEPVAVGRGRRAPSWLEELEHLRSLAEAPAEEPVLATAVSSESAVPADKLAAWLLAQTDLGEA